MRLECDHRVPTNRHAEETESREGLGLAWSALPPAGCPIGHLRCGRILVSRDDRLVFVGCVHHRLRACLAFPPQPCGCGPALWQVYFGPITLRWFDEELFVIFDTHGNTGRNPIC